MKGRRITKERESEGGRLSVRYSVSQTTFGFAILYFHRRSETNSPRVWCLPSSSSCRKGNFTDECVIEER